VREKHRLKEFENRVLRRIFGSNRKVAGDWRRLHHEELHKLYTSSKIKVIKSTRMR
jgi:hypothetical protein